MAGWLSGSLSSNLNIITFCFLCFILLRNKVCSVVVLSHCISVFKCRLCI